jgi:hypothetical protein
VNELRDRYDDCEPCPISSSRVCSEQSNEILTKRIAEHKTHWAWFLSSLSKMITTAACSKDTREKHQLRVNPTTFQQLGGNVSRSTHFEHSIPQQGFLKSQRKQAVTSPSVLGVCRLLCKGTYPSRHKRHLGRDAPPSTTEGGSRLRRIACGKCPLQSPSTPMMQTLCVRIQHPN